MKLTAFKFPGFVLVMLTPLLSLSLLIFAPTTAPATAISDILQVTWTPPVGSGLVGGIFTRTLEEVGGESVTEDLDFTFPTGTSDFKYSNNNSVFLVEPGTVTADLDNGLFTGNQSDKVTIQVQATGQDGGTTTLHFTLNSDQDPGRSNNVDGLLETGQLQDITNLIFAGTTDFGGHTFKVEVASDLDETAPIPEPTTMLLLGSGLIGLAGYGRKKFLKK